jgi:uncharacterized protein with HEPN domain
MSKPRPARPVSRSDEQRVQDILDASDIAWRDLIGLRIVLAHRYHRVDLNQVWVIAQTEVQRLGERLRTDRGD